MAANDFSEDGPEVCCDGEIAAFVALFRCEAGPPSVDFSTAHGATDDHHRIPVTMVRSPVAVLRYSTPELRHRKNHDVLHAIAEVAHESGDAAREIIESGRQQ